MRAIESRRIRAWAPTSAGVAAGALLGSALIHATVVQEHLGEWAPAGVFFLALVVLESALAVVLARGWTTWAAFAVATSSVGTLAVWTVSRTVGMPIGPADFQMPEVVGVPDVACCALEAVAAVLAAAYLGARRDRGAASRGGIALGVLALAVVAAVTVWGLAPSLSVHSERSPGSHSHQMHH